MQSLEPKKSWYFGLDLVLKKTQDSNQNPVPKPQKTQDPGSNPEPNIKFFGFWV
jgi:hypothetical protein